MQPMVNPYAPQQQAMQRTTTPGSEQLDPRLIEGVLAMNQVGMQQRGIDRSRTLADLMRTDVAQQMQMRNAGTKDRPLTVAPNLLNVAANLYGNYKAKQTENDADVRERNLGAQKVSTMRQYFDALRGVRAQPLPYMGAEGE